MSQSQENFRTEGRKNRQIPIHRTLLAMARGPIKDLNEEKIIGSFYEKELWLSKLRPIIQNNTVTLDIK